jgi:hypothetical protein
MRESESGTKVANLQVYALVAVALIQVWVRKVQVLGRPSEGGPQSALVFAQ